LELSAREVSLTVQPPPITQNAEKKKMKRKAVAGVNTEPTTYIDGNSRAKPPAGVNALVTLLDDKARMVSSLSEVGVTEFVPTECFDSVAAAIKYCSDSRDGGRYVLKAATSCDSLDVTHGTKAELKDHLETCRDDPEKSKLYSRCVIQPDIWSICVLADASAVKGGRLVAGKSGPSKRKSGPSKSANQGVNQGNLKKGAASEEVVEMDALVEWRVYVVFCSHKFCVVDKARECWSSKRERWHDFIKTPIGIVDIPDGMTELTSRICEGFVDRMDNAKPMMMGIDFVTDKSTGGHLVLEINVDDAASSAHCGADVGVRSLKRVTRGMSVDEKKYIDRDCMIANFLPK
jgi:hypothetical protein